MSRFVKCKECHFNLSLDENKIACSAGSDIIESSAQGDDGCNAGAYTEELFPEIEDYD